MLDLEDSIAELFAEAQGLGDRYEDTEMSLGPVRKDNYLSRELRSRARTSRIKMTPRRHERIALLSLVMLFD